MSTTEATTTEAPAETVESIAGRAMSSGHPEAKLMSAILSTEWDRQANDKEALRTAKACADAAQQAVEQIEQGQHSHDFVSQRAAQMAEALLARKESNARLSMLISLVDDADLKAALKAAR